MTAVLALALTGVVQGEYERLDDKKNVFEAFVEPASFDINENWAICAPGLVNFSLAIDDGTGNHDAKFAKYLSEVPKTGGGLRLESGTYLVTRPIVLPENSCIIGAGMSETIIRLDDKATPFFNVGKAKGILSCSKQARVSIMALTVDGNSGKQHPPYPVGHPYYTHGRYGVSALQCNYFWTRNVRATNSERAGFFTRGGGEDALYHAFHEACEADGNGREGIELRFVKYASVFNSLVRNNKGTGISIKGASEHTLIKSVRISNSERYGIRLWKGNAGSPRDIMIQNVFIDQSGSAGIYMESVEDTYVKETDIQVKDESPSESSEASACFKVSATKNIFIQDSECNGTHFEGQEEEQGGGSNNISGIVSSGAFCKLECGLCGGEGCDYMGENKSCCISGIKALDKSCDLEDPPCSF